MIGTHCNVGSLVVLQRLNSLFVVHSCACRLCTAWHAVAEALDMRFIPIYSVDPKPASFSFCSSNKLHGGHFLNTLQEATAGMGQCHVHGGTCTLNGEERFDLDCFLAGFPCQPFSRMRIGDRPRIWFLGGS